MFWVDIVSFSLVKNVYFYIVMPTFVLHTLMRLKSSIIGTVRPFFLRCSKVEQGGVRCMRGSKVHEESKVHEGEQGA